MNFKTQYSKGVSPQIDLQTRYSLNQNSSRCLCGNQSSDAKAHVRIRVLRVPEPS